MILFCSWGGPFFQSFYDLGPKKGGPCPESWVGPLSESDNTLSGLVKFSEWLVAQKFGSPRCISVAQIKV